MIQQDEMITIASPSQLAHYPLLHDITAWRGNYEYAKWKLYLSAIGARMCVGGHTFNRNNLTIEAARMGVGLAIARQALIADELEQGSLIIPFGSGIRARKKYVLNYREGALNPTARRAVHDWLVGQTQV
jgi:LysR family glycine cleavage system transcriptional activator